MFPRKSIQCVDDSQKSLRGSSASLTSHKPKFTLEFYSPSNTIKVMLGNRHVLTFFFLIETDKVDPKHNVFAYLGTEVRGRVPNFG